MFNRVGSVLDFKRDFIYQNLICSAQTVSNSGWSSPVNKNYETTYGQYSYIQLGLHITY